MKHLVSSGQLPCQAGCMKPRTLSPYCDNNNHALRHCIAHTVLTTDLNSKQHRYALQSSTQVRIAADFASWRRQSLPVTRNRHLQRVRRRLHQAQVLRAYRQANADMYCSHEAWCVAGASWRRQILFVLCSGYLQKLQHLHKAQVL